ncbi:dTMP kinase [Curvivirga aplysinae]|uniref:dTMP kinase n=1 Tax=Curvivirga aplysinae TaxID=2529852 RepID=UPI0012BCAFE7|nr:dTMP kinase [Curvivirga aplysinae]MTI10047.1 dTMP kinase [Curvivirga aplysinae]
MSIKPGRFISFEGGEGSGKSTQIKKIAAMIERNGIQVILSREPGGSKGGEEIRELLVTGDAGRWDGVTELLLLYAARNDHVEKIIKPAIAEGKWVLCDRFADSTMAYQGYGHELGRERIEQVHIASLGDFNPDLTIIIDIPVEVGLKRALARRDGEDRYENMDISFHQRMRDGYLDIANHAPDRVKVIDGNGEIDEVSERLQQQILATFPELEI